MSTRITAKHGRPCETTREKIKQKVAKLRQYHRRATEVEVIVDLQHRECARVELRVSAQRTSDFVATHCSDDIFCALDALLPKVIWQVQKRNQRPTGHRAGRLGHIEPLGEPEAAYDAV